MAKIIGATSIDSGSSSLKSVDGNYLKDGDLSLVLSENGVFFYKLHDEDGSSENIPYIVKPSKNAGDKRWRMLSITELSEDIRLQKDNSFQLTNIKLGENNEITIYDYSGNEIGKITDSQFIFNNSLQLSDIYTNRINDWNTNKIILNDGSRSFASPVISPDPEYAGHLANKDYIDSETEALSANFQSYKDYVDDNFAKWDNTELHTPSHDYNPSTKKYIDDNISSAETQIYNELSFTVSSSGGLEVENNPADIQFEDNIQASSTGDNSVIVTVPNDLTIISNYDTDDLDEGAGNLYFTTSRIDSHLTGGEGVAYSTGTIDLNIDSLSTEASASPSGDYLCFYDSDASVHKNITPNDLIESIDIVYASVSDNGVQVVANASDINFGTNVDVTDDGNDTVTVTVPNDLTVMSNYDTDNLSEGTGNLYFTTSRVDSHLSGDTGISYSSGTISLNASIADLNDSALPDATAAGQVQIWNTTNEQFENATLSNGGNVTITNADASVTLSVPNDLTVISNYNTDDLSEGTSNLYFTTSRVDSHLTGGEGIAYSIGTIDLDVDSLTTETSASPSDDYICFYDSDAGSHKNITPDDLIGTVGEYASVSDGGTTIVSNASDINFSDNLAVTDDGDGTVTVIGSGGISKLEKRPDSFMLDDENTDVSRSSYWGMTDTLSFGPSGSGAGSVWLNFIIPDSFDTSKDISINIFYTLSGVDDGKTVEIETESWSTSTGSQPAADSEGTFSDTITSGTTNTDNLTKWQLSNGVIPASAIDSTDDLITVKFTRPITDDYSGSFELISTLFYQS